MNKKLCLIAPLLLAAGCLGGDAQDDSVTDQVVDPIVGTTSPSSADGVLALQQLRAASRRPVQIRMRSGVPATVHMDVALASTVPADPELRARSFITQYRGIYRLGSPSTELYLDRVREQDGMTVVFFGQAHAGVPVYNSELAVDLVGGRVLGTRGRYLPAPRGAATPMLTGADALGSAAQALGLNISRATTAPSLTWFDESLIRGSARSGMRLAWRVEIAGRNTRIATGGSWRALIDARTGALIASFSTRPHDEPDKDFDIQTANQTASDTCWAGIFETQNDDWFDEDGPDGYPGAWADPHLDGQHAFDFAHQVYDFFHSRHERHSYNGYESEVELMVHVHPIPQSAYWDPGCGLFAFGDGYVTRDIVAHEFTHAIDSFSGNLVYQDESGALAESFADVMASFVDGNWTIGESVPPTVRAEPMRSLADPPQYGDRDHYSNLNPTTADNGGVHTNSGIMNKAAYLIARGGEFNGFRIRGLGNDKAERLYYSVLTAGVGGHMDFATARDVFVMRAGEFAYFIPTWFTPQNVCDVRNAFAAVGVRESGADRDCDGLEDAVDPDADADGVPDAQDNCRGLANPFQEDIDGDGRGNQCDLDNDGDGVNDAQDNCQWHRNPTQADNDRDGIGNECDDDDGDFVKNIDDNCPTVANREQEDLDRDGIGDVCDPDVDGDGYANAIDTCPRRPNPGNLDSDRDGVGDACDNCASAPNPDQSDLDCDRRGDACDRELTPACPIRIPDLVHHWVHPLDLVAFPLRDDRVLRAGLDRTVTVTATTSAPIALAVVDARGQVVSHSPLGRAHTLRFAPRAGAFQTTTTGWRLPAEQYFIRVDGLSSGPQIELIFSTSIQ